MLLVKLLNKKTKSTHVRSNCIYITGIAILVGVTQLHPYPENCTEKLQDCSKNGTQLLCATFNGEHYTVLNECTFDQLSCLENTATEQWTIVLEEECGVELEGSIEFIFE